MSICKKVELTLEKTFAPEFLEVIDESHHHAGHSGAREGETTHVRVIMRASSLKDMRRVQQHQAVNAALKWYFDEGGHALALEVGALEISV